MFKWTKFGEMLIKTGLKNEIAKLCLVVLILKLSYSLMNLHHDKYLYAIQNDRNAADKKG